MRLMLRRIRSYFAGMKASAALGRASRLQRDGKSVEALSVARTGLAALSKPYVFRNCAAEGAALVTLTVLVEAIAFEAKVSGASRHDLRDSLAFLKLLSESPTHSVSDLLAWVPYLEARLAQMP